MSRLPANQQVLACGHNEAGNLFAPPHCPRWDIDGQNPCEHNAFTSDGRSYCSKMVLRPTHVLWTDNVRVIWSFPKSSFLDINGCLQVLPPYLALRARFDYPAGKDIKRLFEFDGRTKLGFYTNNGCLWLLDLLKSGLKGLSVYFTTWQRQILHLCWGGYAPAVLVVHKTEPNILTQFPCFEDCLAWLVECQKPGAFRAFSLVVGEPIAQIVGNLCAFTVRLEGGRVYTWDVEAFSHSPKQVTVIEPPNAPVADPQDPQEINTDIDIPAPTPDLQEIKTDVDHSYSLTAEEIQMPVTKVNDNLQVQSPQGVSPKTHFTEITIIELSHEPAADLQEIKIDGDPTPTLTLKEIPLAESKAEEVPQGQSPPGLCTDMKTKNEPAAQSRSKSEVNYPIKSEKQSVPPLRTDPDSKIEGEIDPTTQTLYYSLVNPPPKPDPPSTPPPKSEPPRPTPPWFSDTSSPPPSPPPAPAPAIPVIRRLVVPPSNHLTAARFLTGSLSQDGVHLWRDPTTDDPSEPQLSDIGTPIAPILQHVGEGIRLIDVSISAHHVVVVAESGEVFSKGRGWHGELGIGEKVFDLGNREGDTEDGGREFAEEWVEMDIGDVREGMRVRRAYTGEGTTFLVAEKVGGEKIGEEDMGDVVGGEECLRRMGCTVG